MFFINNTLFWKLFSRRALICFIIIIFLFLSCILRVAVIAVSDISSANVNQNRLRITLGKARGTIFDKNMIPLTNNTEKIIAVVTPTPRAITAISAVLKGNELENVLNVLKQGKPATCVVPKIIECDGIICTKVFTNSNDNINHFIGYTDTDNKGVCGLELAYDNILNYKNDISVYYECNAKGEILPGCEPETQCPSVFSNGIVSTFDINIQNIAESAAKSIERGCVIIADAKNGKIRASVSRPEFKLSELSAILNDSNSPLLNRAINSYNVGSVFKPCVAIAGIENGYGEFKYICTGSCEIIDRFFKCHKYDGHSLMNLKSGLANSCNTFFYNFAFLIGRNEIYNTMKNLKFGKSLALCNNISTDEGSIPSKQSLENIAYLANLSIGQGELLLSPISILPLYLAIANNGKYYVPSIIEATIIEGKTKKYEIGNPTRVMKNETADILKQYLASVLTDGTGIDALPSSVTAAGKTATAQTGKYRDEYEICQGWFCGFFPLENPKYVVVVFSEDITNQSESCNKIFAKIADQITELEN